MTWTSQRLRSPASLRRPSASSVGGTPPPRRSAPRGGEGGRRGKARSELRSRTWDFRRVRRARRGHLGLPGSAGAVPESPHPFVQGGSEMAQAALPLDALVPAGAPEVSELGDAELVARRVSASDSVDPGRGAELLRSFQGLAGLSIGHRRIRRRASGSCRAPGPPGGGRLECGSRTPWPTAR